MHAWQWGLAIEAWAGIENLCSERPGLAADMNPRAQGIHAALARVALGGRVGGGVGVLRQL